MLELKTAEEMYEYCKDNKMGTGFTNSPAKQIKEFKELLDMGILTQAEFDAKKKELLGL